MFKRANRRGFTVREYDLEALAENAQCDLFHNSCSTVYRPLSEPLVRGKSKISMFHAAYLDTEATISPYLHYTSNLIKDTSSLVYCLTTVKLRIEAGPRIDAGPRIQAGGLIHLYR